MRSRAKASPISSPSFSTSLSRASSKEMRRFDSCVIYTISNRIKQTFATCKFSLCISWRYTLADSPPVKSHKRRLFICILKLVICYLFKFPSFARYFFALYFFIRSFTSDTFNPCVYIFPVIR